MSTKLFGRAWAALLLSAGDVAPAQDAGPRAPQDVVVPHARPSGPVRFEAVVALGQEPGATPQLRGGAVARTADWPASLFARFQTPQGAAVCTAALVGPQAMLTAAHCVPTTGEVSFKYGADAFVTDCEVHPSYANGSDASADFALCKVRPTATRPGGVPLKAGDQFERISTSGMDALVSTSSGTPKFIILTGYGCISDVASQGGIDSKYRIGRTYFVESSNSSQRSRDPSLYTPQERNNLFTVDDTTYANLCPGDSGGPSFREIEGRRAIIGVNSRVFYRNAARTLYGASLVSATGGPAFGNWAMSWARERANVRVCGLHGDQANCRPA